MVFPTSLPHLLCIVEQVALCMCAPTSQPTSTNKNKPNQDLSIVGRRSTHIYLSICPSIYNLLLAQSRVSHRHFILQCLSFINPSQLWRDTPPRKSSRICRLKYCSRSQLISKGRRATSRSVLQTRLAAMPPHHLCFTPFTFTSKVATLCRGMWMPYSICYPAQSSRVMSVA